MSNELWIVIIIVILALLLCLLLAIANFAGERFFEKYKQMNAILVDEDITTQEFFNRINASHFEGRIQVAPVANVGGDAYAKGILFLSNQTLSSQGLAGFTIIAHEMGHALQDATGRKLKRLHALRWIGKIVGIFMMPCYLVGLVLLIIGGNLFYWGIGCIAAGFLIFLLAIIIKAVTIAVEKDASKHAVAFLSEYLHEKEVKKCKRFLKDAKLTYWADLFRSLLGWTMLTRKSKLFK